MFTDSEVNSINDFQFNSFYHPLTCAFCHVILIASETGLHCPSCDYRQDDVVEFMKDWSWKSTEYSELVRGLNK